MKIAKVLKRVDDIRRDALDQLTAYLVKNSNEVTIEDLNAKDMMADKTLARHVTRYTLNCLLECIGY